MCSSTNTVCRLPFHNGGGSFYQLKFRKRFKMFLEMCYFNEAKLPKSQTTISHRIRVWRGRQWLLGQPIGPSLTL